MKNQNEVIKTLRDKAAVDPVLNAVLHMWALRKRARNTVTIQSLAARMEAEGFSYTQDEYVPVLKLLAALGLGTLTKSMNKVKGLHGIEVTLQSIGMAVLGKQVQLDAWKPRNKYEPIKKAPAMRMIKLDTTPIERRQNPAASSRPGLVVAASVTIGVSVNGKQITIPMPKDLTTEEIASVIHRFRDISASA